MRSWYWEWVKEQQRDADRGWIPPLPVLLTLTGLLALITVPAVLLVDVVAPQALFGWQGGLGLALVGAFALASRARHQAKLDEQDRWQP